MLSCSPRPAARLWRIAVQSEGKQQWRLHLRLLQEQLQDFQAALALALTLNRTLVLPRFWCSCVWAQWPFVTAGNVNCQPHHMQATLEP